MLNRIRKIFSNRRSRLWLWGLLIITASMGAYYVSSNNLAEAAGEGGIEQTQTAQARRGDIVLLASGTGVVIPAQEVGVGSEETGKLSQLNVILGDAVSTGDILASIETNNTLESLALEVALAEQAVAEARQLLEDAQVDFNSSSLRASQATIDSYYAELIIAGKTLENAQKKFEALAHKSIDDLARAQAQSVLSDARANYDNKVANYNWSIGTGDEIEQEIARANLNVALATLAKSEADLAEAIQKSIFIDLLSPIDGVVTDISSDIGESVNSTTIITIANLERTLLEVFLDEADLDKVAIGDEVEVVFDAYPDLILTGIVLGIDPSLQTVQNVSTVVALVEIIESPNNLTFPIGMQAVADVISGKAENVVLVPIEALREIDANEYVVFVLENGEPRVRSVSVGLIDFTSAEIISGVEVGETVTTGLVETQ